MERGLAVAAFSATATERAERESSPSSRSSSGCQSGWTLYLDHSNNGVARYVPVAQTTWMLLQQADHADDDGDRDNDEEEDSMASDASSGPRPLPREEDDDDDDARRDFGLRRHDEFVADQCRCSYSTSSGASGSGFLGSSTWSRSSQQGGVAMTTTAAAVFRGKARDEVIVIDDDSDDELDDTASSSVVFSCPMPMLHAR